MCTRMGCAPGRDVLPDGLYSRIGCSPGWDVRPDGMFTSMGCPLGLDVHADEIYTRIGCAHWTGCAPRWDVHPDECAPRWMCTRMGCAHGSSALRARSYEVRRHTLYNVSHVQVSWSGGNEVLVVFQSWDILLNSSTRVKSVRGANVLPHIHCALAWPPA